MGNLFSFSSWLPLHFSFFLFNCLSIIIIIIRKFAIRIRYSSSEYTVNIAAIIYISLSFLSLDPSPSGNSSKQGGNRYGRYEIGWIDVDILEELVEVMSRKTFEILGWRGSNFVFGICKMEDVFHRSFYLGMEEEQLQIVESLAIRGVFILYMHDFLIIRGRV